MASLLLLAGCATTVRSRAGDGWKPEVNAAQLRDVVEKRREAIQGLRGTARLQVTLEVEREESMQEERLSTTQAVIVRAPASFRFEAVTAFGVGYAVASDGKNLAVFVPSEGLVYRGQARPQTVGAATGVPADPADVAQILLGVPPLSPLDMRAAKVSYDAPSISKEHSELDLDVEPVVYLSAPLKPQPVAGRRPGRPAQKPDRIVIGFAPPVAGSHQLVPILFERLSADGDLLLRAHFGGFRSTSKALLATHIGLEVDGSRAELEWRTIALDPSIGPSSFALTTPAGMRDARLDPPPAAERERSPRGS